MKIQAIRIKNLASLDGTTEIDFTSEPLASAGIFAITGPTGAGKSTVLDALCLALYAKTPRYRQAENGVDISDVKGNTIKQDDVRGILRDGTSNGYAEVDFTGIDGQRYRATWRVRRAFNREDGSLQPHEMSLKNITTGEDIPGRKTELLVEIERLVGLSFEQFTRSVLLAQGDFTAFLKAGRDDKSSLLEKLTGTHVYSEISRRVFDHHRVEQQALRELHLQREGVVTLSDEEIQQLDAQEKELSAAIKTHEGQRDQLQKEIDWHVQWSALQENHRAAQLAHQQAEEAKTAAQPHNRELQQIVRVQSAAPLVTNLQQSTLALAQKNDELEKTTVALNTLGEQKTASELRLQQSATLLSVATSDEESSRPLLQSARVLDVQLTDKAEQLQKAEEEVATHLTKENQQSAVLQQSEKDAEAQALEIAGLIGWTSENEHRRSVAEQADLILSKLTDAEGLVENRRLLTPRIQAAGEGITQLQEQLQAAVAQQQLLANSRDTLSQAYEALQSTLSATPIHDIQQEKAAVDATIEIYIQAESHWKLLSQAIRDKEELTLTLSQRRAELEEKSKQSALAEIQLGQLKAIRDNSQKLLERSRLEAAENVETLRSQLKADEPCPVCGSYTHPYSDHHPVVDQLLATLESSHSENDTAYTQQLTASGSLRQHLLSLQQTIDELTKKHTQQAASQQALETEWQSFRAYLPEGDTPLRETTTFLQEQLQQYKYRQRQLQEKRGLYEKQKESLEKQKESLSDNDKQIVAVDNLVKDHQRSIASLQSQLTNDSEALEKVNTQLHQVEQLLSVYFPVDKWFENWQSNPSLFVQSIRQFAKDWQTNKKKLEELERQQATLAEKVSGLRQQHKSIVEDKLTKEAHREQLRTQHQQLSAERRQLFNGESASNVENKLKEAIRKAKEAWEDDSQVNQQLSSEVARQTALSEQLQKDITAQQKQVASHDELLGEWVSRHNRQYEATLTRAMLDHYLTHTQEQIEQERNRLQAIDDSLKHAHTILGERSQALEVHLSRRLSTKTADELKAAKGTVLEQLADDTRQIHEIAFKRKEDAAHKEQLGTLFQSIEKQTTIVEGWAKLNEVIGSADGKKFRQIAQEYTLDVLLSYANSHLEMLSKRYQLQRIPNSLGLQVIDQDMGNEVRTVYSLSGGESFLVSLALALGLASLSSSRMQVESLFIDEGFGSLDPSTLNIAMDALDRLHHQGRKVGVISHVQEMTERIPVQINVSKQQSGKSKINVVGI